MTYQIHSFTGYDVSIANMISDWCERNHMRVHTAWYEPSRKGAHATVRVLFEVIDRIEV